MLDAVSALLVGKHGKLSSPILYVGRAMSVSGLDSTGKEIFWVASSDVVSALAIADIDRDGTDELVAGSQACDLQVYKQVREHRPCHSVFA